MPNVYTRVIGAAIVVAAAGCGHNPVKPTPTADPPVISCPGSVTMRGVPGGSQTVTFPAPTTIGGELPVSVTCAPASGTVFTAGVTPVACGAVDARGRQSLCSFSVTITPLLLSVTKFVAFGDSFTEGENGRAGLFGERVIDLPNVYPTKLELLLNAEYPGQSIVVANRGKSGEAVEGAVGRLPGVLAAARPDVLLLLDGYNNLGTCSPSNAGSAACAQKISDVVFGLRDCIRIAKSPAYAIKYIFVSTLTPPGPYLGGNDRRIALQAIIDTNARLAPMVRSEGAILVDTFPRFIGHEVEYVDQDGLHLRPAGYQALAESFFAAIKAMVTSTPGLGAPAPFPNAGWGL